MAGYRAVPLALFAAALAACGAAEPPVSAAAEPAAAAPARAFRIVRNDPRLDAVIAPDAELELVGDRFGLTEGPVWVPDDDDGFWLFSDLISNVIYRWAPGEPISVYLDRAGYSGDDLTSAGYQTRRGRMAVLLIGPNGLSLDAEGRLIYLATPDRRVMRLEPDGTRTVIADRWQGRRFNGPNDLAIDSEGRIYLTDSVWGIRDGLANPDSELDFSGVYLIEDGAVTLLYSDAERPGGWPNGIALSPDESMLYMNAGIQNILRFDVLADGTLANETVFIAGEGSDGMKVDSLGNLYTTSGAGPGQVRITAPDGTRLGVLALPLPAGEPQAQVCATNVAFGGADSKTLLITACEHVYRIRLRVAGIHPAA
ncbi:MAG: SMP-30/gluconolactonase/LRE family protein [Gammaproteobacteria bacterium]|nr:SMP-30/gluconolactonase/LRE family protein [Gammaproteobacteria bacterium]